MQLPLRESCSAATAGDYGRRSAWSCTSGQLHVQSISIEDGLTGHELEQSILEATNAAGAAAKQLYAEAIAQMADDMDLHLPGLDNILTHMTGGG